MNSNKFKIILKSFTKIIIKNKIKSFLLFAFGFMAIAFIILFSASGSFLNKTYLDPWKTDYYKKFSDPRMQVVSHGLLAPNAHNMQSWRIVLDEQDKLKFKLYLNENRLIPETDPYHRQSIISQGTFLELVNISAKELGYEAKIATYPNGEFDVSPTKEEIRKTPTAEVELVESDIEEDYLYNSIFNRVTSRTEYLNVPLTLDQINEIMSINTNPSIQVFIFQDSDELKYIQDLAIEGVVVESSLERTMAESNKVLRYSEYQKNKYAYGLTLSSQGWSKTKQFFIESISSIFPQSVEKEGEIWRNGERIKIKKTPAYIMIVSEKNDRKTQVEVGRLYARIQLAGTDLGLSMQPTSQVLQEFSEMSELYKSVNDKFTMNRETVQMLFRVGESKIKVEHSPRMNPEKLLE